MELVTVLQPLMDQALSALAWIFVAGVAVLLLGSWLASKRSS
jgi:hypothetical protein